MKNLVRTFFPLVLFAAPLFVVAQTATSSTPYGTLTQEQQQEIDQLKKKALDLLSPQSIAQNSVSEYLKVQFSPQRPKPGETVRVSAESFLVDLSKATMSWSVNGKVIERAIGKTSFSFQVGTSGVTTRLGILISLPTGGEVYKEYGFNPIGLTLLWEADTYTPPFYKGKPLASYQSRVRAIAIPDAMNTKDAVKADTLSYVWSQNGYAVSEASGYAKNSYTFTAPRPYEDMRINASASPLTGGALSEFSLSLPVADPFVLFYEDNPLLGVRYGRPLVGEFSLTEKDVSVRAEPFFFSNERGEAPLFDYTWELNGKVAQNYGRSILLRNTEGAVGESLITFGIRGTVKTFQSASQSLKIKFGAQEKKARF